MGNTTGFLTHDRREATCLNVNQRIQNYREFTALPNDGELLNQSSRCMDCGIPFCQSGCPLNNQIPDWNDLVYSGEWQAAIASLHATNNFPEFTGRVCPAPCEASCTLYLADQPVTIKNIEQAIADRAWRENWIIPQPADRASGYTVAVIGSGPAGMAAAQQLARVGHAVTVFEREAQIGGLLRYGIPDFKLEKPSIERRRKQMEAEGVEFRVNTEVGTDISLSEVHEQYGAVLLTIGAENPREVGLGGFELAGNHYAMDYLRQQNKRVSNEPLLDGELDILATDLDVVVIGGGDTASDCIGTAIRQGCASVTQLDIRPTPPIKENKDLVWPYWPGKMRVSTSQAEGAAREFATATIGVVADDSSRRVQGLRCVQVDDQRKPIAETEFMLKAELILHAIGFAGTKPQPLLEQLNAKIDSGRRIVANTEVYKTSVAGVFAAGDARYGQSLVVTAIREGRQAARSIDVHLTGSSRLPR